MVKTEEEYGLSLYVKCLTTYQYLRRWYYLFMLMHLYFRLQVYFLGSDFIALMHFLMHETPMHFNKLL